ncbi:MAG: phenylalanine--tRNA ligase subunit beta [Pirellulaceae bacterium]|nr:phenylalanine--tRNA ligase subunit beta [Pirellulaceae bacterium]
MLVCWEWLSQYVNLTTDPDTLAHRFAMSGLNHESTTRVGQDVVIDLEVTSNRGDCLGHIGVAREASVLLDSPLCLPNPQPKANGPQASASLKIENRFEAGCSRYTARIIRGVKIGRSPAWLVRRLAAIGINSVNNVVDITNYVMMECGQPLHAFDLKHIRGGKIIVRPAQKNEKFLAIDHHTYDLDERMVVIADAERAVALGGVMGGADSEVSESTTDLLIESAAFEPLLIRRAARKLKLQSPSSYRFERRPDPSGLDWASRRCCELILEIAGGTLCEGRLDTAADPQPRDEIRFRLSQIERILGIDISTQETDRILKALGCNVAPVNPSTISVTPPSWRADLQREVDLIEEVARIHGYDQIPENVAVPLSVAAQRPKDLALRRARQVLSAYGIDEAMTPSVVTEQLDQCGSIWTEAPALTTEIPLLIGAKFLRRSLIPSLLAAKYTNQSQSIRDAQLYEVATVFIPGAAGTLLPREQSVLALVGLSDLSAVKGAVEDLIAQVASKKTQVQWIVSDHASFAPGSAQRIELNGELLGYVGLVHPKIQGRLALDQAVAAAELNVDLLTSVLEEVRRADAVSAFPSIARDLNFIVDEPLRWSDLHAACRVAGGEFLKSVSYRETYRDPQKDGVNKKRTLLTLHFQSMDRTLNSEEVDQAVAAIIAQCAQQFSAKLLG